MLSLGCVAQRFVEEDKGIVLFFAIMNNTKISVGVVEFVIRKGGFFGLSEGDGCVQTEEQEANYE